MDCGEGAAELGCVSIRRSMTDATVEIKYRLMNKYANIHVCVFVWIGVDISLYLRLSRSDSSSMKHTHYAGDMLGKHRRTKGSQLKSRKDSYRNHKIFKLSAFQRSDKIRKQFE